MKAFSYQDFILLDKRGQVALKKMAQGEFYSTLQHLESTNVDHFDWLAPLYDRVIKAPTEDILGDLLELPIEGRLLDAGGGTGRIAQHLKDRVGKVVIADGSLPMLSLALDKNCCEVVGGTTEALPFSDHSFERVIIVDAYHHLADQMTSLQESWRVLSPGGLLVIEEPDIDHPGVKLIALLEKITFFRSHFIRAEGIAEALHALGTTPEIHRSGHNVWILARKV